MKTNLEILQEIAKLTRDLNYKTVDITDDLIEQIYDLIELERVMNKSKTK